MRRTPKATAKAARGAASEREPDPIKDAANELVDAMVASNGEQTLAFAQRVAAERARAHSLGQFTMYSTNNRLYLEAQARKRQDDLKFLFAGPKMWNRLDREVVADAVPYKVFGRLFREIKELDAQGNEVTRRIPCGRTPLLDVYDWTQTRSTNPDYVEPDWETPLVAGDNGMLLALADSADIEVRFEDLAARNAHGAYDGTSITIDETAAVGNQIVELARQLAHHVLGHPPVGTRQAKKRVHEEGQAPYTARYVAEQEAALTGWLVAKALGLDESIGNEVTAQCAEYLNRWTKFDKDGNAIDLEGIKSRRKLVADRLDVALKAADTILAGYCAQRNLDLVTA